MKISKNTTVQVRHKRLGKFVGIVSRDFDTDEEEFYPIKLYQDTPIYGLSTTFIKGDDMPCRNEFVKIIIIDEIGGLNYEQW